MLLEHLPEKEREDVIDMVESFQGLCDKWSVVSPWNFSKGGYYNLTNYTTLNQCLIYFASCF